MNKLLPMIAFAAVLLSSTLVTSSAYGKGWVTEPKPKEANPTANHGKVKICGDHICKPFEYDNMLKKLYDMQKSKQTSHLNMTKK